MTKIIHDIAGNRVQPAVQPIGGKKEDQMTYEQQFKFARAHFAAAAEAEVPVQIACAGLVLTYGGPDAVELCKELEKFCQRKETEYFNKKHEKPKILPLR